MSEKYLYSNEVSVSFNHESIHHDFDFFHISTSEKYIKGGASFLDMEEIQVLSIQFESGKSFYLMLSKNTMLRTELIRILNEKEGGKNLSLKAVSSTKLPEHILTQLFLNALSNPSDERLSFNNLSGKLLCFRSSWLDKKEDNFIWGLQCLEVKVGEDRCLRLTARKLSSLALKKYMKFEKRKLQDYPQYELSFNGLTLKRVSNDKKDRKENFIIKPLDGERGGISFLDFSNLESFTSTKVGVLYDVIKALHKKFGNYLQLDFKKYEIDEVLECRRKSLDEYKEIVKEEFINLGLHIVDEVQTETSLEYLRDVSAEIKKIIPELQCSFGKKLSGKKFNLCYIHDKDFYEEEDAHNKKKEDYSIQHITVENFNPKTTAVIQNLLKELIIKRDLNHNRLTIVDWKRYGFHSDWIFGMESDKDYYFMRIHPDGSFKIEKLELNLFTFSEFNTYMEYFGVEKERKKDGTRVIGLIKDEDGNVNLIRETNKYSLPNFLEIGDILENVAREGKFLGRDLIEWLKKVIDLTEKKGVKEELELILIKIDEKKEYKKKEILELIKGRNAKKEVVSFIFENTGEMLYSYLRGEAERKEYFSGNIDINYIEDGSRAIYSVGDIGSGMNTSIERASLIREIEVTEGSELFFKKLLPLMEVSFVRYGMLTVLPFPFKYLREFILKEKMLF